MLFAIAILPFMPWPQAGREIMRRFCAAILLSVAACSAPNEDHHQEQTDASGPDVAVTRVRGVSMAYSYGFRLPASHIIAVQEEHAAQCEALTPPQCRITGMTYDFVANRQILASLQMRLAPDIARSFGKKGVDITAKRGGMLTSARIDSEESGTIAAASDRSADEADAAQKEIAGQLAKPVLSSRERAALQERMAQLSDRRNIARATSEDARAKLASTPMVFQYESGAVDPGLQDGPVLGAVKEGWSNIVSGFATILTLLISALPWVLTATLLAIGWRWAAVYVRRRLLPRDE